MKDTQEAESVGEASKLVGACDDCGITPHGHRTMFKMEDGFTYCGECVKDHGYRIMGGTEVVNS